VPKPQFKIYKATVSLSVTIGQDYDFLTINGKGEILYLSLSMTGYSDGSATQAYYFIVDDSTYTDFTGTADSRPCNSIPCSGVRFKSKFNIRLHNRYTGTAQITFAYKIYQ
jgi:hypothetical protein